MSDQSQQRCRQCGKLKPLIEFTQDKISEHPLIKTCNDCLRFNERLKAIQDGKPKRQYRTASKRKKATGADYLKWGLMLAGAIAVLSTLESFMEKMPSWFPLLIPLGIMVGVGIVRWLKDRD
jgi:hypothetical protein